MSLGIVLKTKLRQVHLTELKVRLTYTSKILLNVYKSINVKYSAFCPISISDNQKV